MREESCFGKFTEMRGARVGEASRCTRTRAVIRAVMIPLSLHKQSLQSWYLLASAKEERSNTLSWTCECPLNSASASIAGLT
jgi:hypothetical protein